MAALSRITMILIAYVLACVAASFVLTFGTLTPDWDDLAELGVQSGALAPVIGVGAAAIFVVALLPAIAVIALAEAFALRSVVAYGVLGGAIALVLSSGLDFVRDAGGPDGAFYHERLVLAAAGIAGGLVYWLFAGRRAGSRTELRNQ